jgi:hypothetical protein
MSARATLRTTTSPRLFARACADRTLTIRFAPTSMIRLTPVMEDKPLPALVQTPQEKTTPGRAWSSSHVRECVPGCWTRWSHTMGVSVATRKTGAIATLTQLPVA